MALSDEIAARAAREANPVFSTDTGINSVSSPFLSAATTRSTASVLGSASSADGGWADTSAAITANDQQAAAIKRQVAAQKAAAAAAARAQAQSRALTAQALASDKRNRALSGGYGGSGGFTPNGGVMLNRGMDAQSVAAERHAQAMGYNLNASNYSKRYVADSSLSAARNQALASATSYLGTPYVLGGESHSSIDCSGLVQTVYNQLGYNIRVHGATWQKNNIPGTRISWGSSKLKPGDLVCWNDGSHIAIYAGNGKIIEAANTNVGTVERNLWDSPGNVTCIHLAI